VYNAGSFFDPQAIPPADDEEIARTVGGFERVIVEAHPAFLAGAYADRCRRFQGLIEGRLEVAIGLETAHPDVLTRLNKRMTLDAFRRAAEFLHRHDVLRVFILLNPPFMRAGEAVSGRADPSTWPPSAARPHAHDHDRGGNGAIRRSATSSRPRLSHPRVGHQCRLSRGGPRVFADLWDVDGSSPAAVHVNARPGWR
jgi:hypothetical protein